jgi:hypothetical protein
MFHVGNSDVMRAAGLTGGHVFVTFFDEALELRGDTGGVIRIPPAELERARIGYVDAKDRRYRARLWRAGDSAPLLLEPSPGTWPAYARAMMASRSAWMPSSGFDASSAAAPSTRRSIQRCSPHPSWSAR